MQVETQILTGDAGASFEADFIWADVDDETGVETPIDLTGYSATMAIRKSDADENILTLTSSPAAGLTITAGDGQVTVRLTAAQMTTLAEDGGRHAFKIDLTVGGADPVRMTAGQIHSQPWP
jgi:hypothetical protein